MGRHNSISGKKSIHFVGIGGIGMSGIARLFLDMGHRVSGSDLELNNLTKDLRSRGGRIFEGHCAANLPDDADILVYSSSISKKNPELKKALRRKMRTIHRAEALGALFNRKKGIAVTGTHGKTTTTSLISVILKNLSMDPTVVIGGEVDRLCGNACLGNGEYFVAEADESDKSFLYFKPFYTVITNIEAEHLDHYCGLGDIKKSFRSFTGNLKRGGTIFYNADDPVTREIMKGFHRKSESFGMSADADIYPLDIKLNGFKTSFKCIYKNNILGVVELSIPGAHNVQNGLAAILVGLKMGLSFDAIVNAVRDFAGARRRFQLRIDTGGIMLIDDYAHHPTEIRAVLNACRSWKRKRLIAVFQPHRYTRTKFLADDFGKCFFGADKLILTDIYAASEKPIKDISIKTIYDRVVSSGLKDVEIVRKEKIPSRVMELARRGDMVVVMGAGDIKKVTDKLCEKLKGGGLDLEDYADALRRVLKGILKPKENLARHTSFKIGGPVDAWVEPADTADLRRVIKFAKVRKIPFFVMGNGTNILASDSGFRGIMINLSSPAFRKLNIKRQTLTVGSGYSLPKLVTLTCGKSLAGLESLVGIPGTVGGAIYMNAGGFTNPIYKNMGGLVRSLKVMDYDGNVKMLKSGEVEFGYRFSNLDGYIILEAVLRLEKGERETLLSSLTKFMKIKRDKQVLDSPSAGCVFKNPPNFQFTCGQMIDMLGLKGLSIGGAQVSEKHANFIVNRNGATCRDILELADFIKIKIKENYDVTLNMEIKVV